MVNPTPYFYIPVSVLAVSEHASDTGEAAAEAAEGEGEKAEGEVSIHIQVDDSLNSRLFNI